MANNYFPLYDEPIIEYVDVVKINPYDISKRKYESNADHYETVKWCRRNFGNRGDGWDFHRHGTKIIVEIWSSKLATMWELWQE